MARVSSSAVGDVPPFEPRFLVLSVGAEDTEVREYKWRKAHCKDRLGCAACKLKRVKVRGRSRMELWMIWQH
jgi:hypothetical protein